MLPSERCRLAVNEAIRIALRDAALLRRTHSSIDTGEVYRPKRSTVYGRNGKNYCYLHEESRAIPTISFE
jgi:hypothetical protein